MAVVEHSHDSLGRGKGPKGLSYFLVRLTHRLLSHHAPSVSYILALLDTNGTNRGPARTTFRDSLRQRARTHQPAFSGVVRGAADRTGAHSAGQADAECARGKLSWTAARRVFGGELVSESIRCAAEDRGVARRVQRTTPAQQFGISNTKGICYIDEGG
jgi:hypothetical protein